MSILRKLIGAIHLLWGILVFVSGMLITLPFVLMAAFLFKGSRAIQIIFFFLNIWGYWIMLLCFMPVWVYGKEKLKKGQSYVYISNHNSYLDAPIIVIANKAGFKALGKIEMMKIPVFSMIYSKVCVLIDRSSKESRAASVAQLREEIEKGTSIHIFPEGTMNRNEEIPLTDFYDGAFRLAIETQTPIVPIAIINARKLLPRDNALAIKPGKVYCHFLEPVPVNKYTADSLIELKAEVHKQLTEAILTHS